jgi:hypothetical protein
MAIVRKLERLDLDHATNHTEAECTYSVIRGPRGEKSLQIDTYGSTYRKMPGKKSQSLSFSPEALAQLRLILENEF